MSYIHLLNQFWQFHATRSISPQATCLYLFLVQRCNRQHWTNPFIIADAHICAELGMARNTMRLARAQLVALGLIAHQPGGHGRGDAAQYALLDSTTGQLLAIQVKKGSESIPFPTPLPAKKGVGKGVDSAPYSYKEENNTRSSVQNEDEEGAAAPASGEHKEGRSEKGLTPIVAPNAWAPHTRGGAERGPLLPFSASAYCTEAGIQKVAQNLALGAVNAPHYLAQIRTKTEGEPDRTELKWRTYVQHFLTNDVRRQQLVTQAPQAGDAFQASQYQAAVAQAWDPGSTPTAPALASHIGCAAQPDPKPGAAPSGYGTLAGPGLVLPFPSTAFLEAWDRYRRHRIEQHCPLFVGSQQEQAALQAVAELAKNDESTALQLIAQTIRKGWKNFYPLDPPRYENRLVQPYRTGAADTRLRHALGNPNFAGDVA